MGTGPPTGSTTTRRLRELGSSRAALSALGWVAFALGAIGVFVPLLPTTVFWIVAVWCWMRSAPHRVHWLLAHPRFGPALEGYLERGEISRSGKRWAIVSIAAGYLLYCVTVATSWVGMTAVGVLLAGVATWLALRPEPALAPAAAPTATDRRTDTADPSRNGDDG